jgi:hypothetical protein
VIERNFSRGQKLLCTGHGDQAAQATSMFHDPTMALIATILAPLLLINSIGLARAVLATVRSIAGGGARVSRRVRASSSSL